LLIQEELEKQLKDLLGEKTAADDEKLVKKKKEKKPRAEVLLQFFDPYKLIT
jgi:hypothetical protein